MTVHTQVRGRAKTALATLGVIAGVAGALAPAASALNPQPLPPYQHPPTSTTRSPTNPCAPAGICLQ